MQRDNHSIDSGFGWVGGEFLMTEEEFLEERARRGSGPKWSLKRLVGWPWVRR